MFNIKRAVVVKNVKKGKTREKKEKGNNDILYVLYLVETYDLFTRGDKKKFMLTVWSIMDRRYVLTTYSNDPDVAMGSILRTYKMKNTRVLDLRGKSKKEVKEFYELRYI